MARNKRHRRGEGGAIGPILAILAIVVMVGGTGAFFFWSYSRSQGPEIDEVSLCPKTGPTAHLAILVDTTDPISLTQLEAARQQIERKIAEAAVHTRISFATVNPDADTRRGTFFSMCKPQSGDDASILTQNPQMIEARFRNKFVDPVSEALSALLRVPEAQTSPIMESAQELAARIPGFTVADAPRELVLMSDLVQHSEVFSFYRGGDWNSFVAADGPAQFGSAYGAAAVTVLRIPRLPARTAVIDDFWVRYFDAQGFDDIRVTRLGGL
ncbi:MAG: hypothetical protein RI571_10805 [Roseovarius sp.]|jgi:hypothetical protein|nr:hypothetical protein [Roseovarius sp.]